MSRSDTFELIRRHLARVIEPYTDDADAFRAAVAALAFELSVCLDVMPDDFAVTGILHTDKDIARENAWTAALDTLYQPFLLPSSHRRA